MKNASEQPFRLMLIFYNELAALQATPLNGVPSPSGHEAVGGMIRGKDDLVSLISHIGIDSVVQTRQLRKPALSENGPPAFERIFNVLPPSQIISTIERHFAAYADAEVKILSTDRSLTELDALALPALQEIVLGSSTLSPSEGFQRMMDWFGRRALETDRRAL